MEDKVFCNNAAKLKKFAESRDIGLRNELILDNQELVWFIVKRYTSGIATREDMFQAGILGLIIAIERFDPSKGVQLSTYAVPYIQNEIRRLIDNPDYIEDHAGLEAVAVDTENPYRDKLDELYTKLLTYEERRIAGIVLRTNDEPAWSINDIAKETKLPARRIREAYASCVYKLNQPWVRWYIQQLRKNLL